jgi:hypothetical protein
MKTKCFGTKITEAKKPYYEIADVISGTSYGPAQKTAREFSRRWNNYKRIKRQRDNLKLALKNVLDAYINAKPDSSFNWENWAILAERVIEEAK